jgi:hypothetical protein
MYPRFVLGAALSILPLAACGSDSTAPLDPAIGTWIGTYGPIGQTGPSEYTFFFFAGDSVHVIAGLPPFDPTHDARGTWNRSGTTITTDYTYVGVGDSYSTTGTLSATTGAAGTTITGTWGSSPSTTNGGGFIVTKQ